MYEYRDPYIIDFTEVEYYMEIKTKYNDMQQYRWILTISHLMKVFPKGLYTR